MNNDLKPCPFCGSEAQVNIVEPHAHSVATFISVFNGATSIECTLCGCAVLRGTEEDAITAWNRRADEPRKTAEFPPTEADGGRIDSDWLPGKNSVIAWSAMHKLWVTKKVVSVASYPDDYPFWIPAPPNPEKEENNP